MIKKRTVRWLKLGCMLGMLVGESGCPTPTSSGPDSKAVDTAAQDFLESSPDLAKTFQNTETAALTHFRIEVLVDQSASMEGYASSTINLQQKGATVPRNSKIKATPSPVPNSDFFDLLHQLANENELIEYLGFGSDADGSPTTFTSYGKAPPLAASQYRRRNNDYADLLDEIEKRSHVVDGEPVERIIITDGVQSHQDKGKGSALGITVEKLRAWVDKGGAVEMRLFTAPYAGTYYSEELRARNLPYSYQGHTGSRPFLAISLISKKEDMPAWKKFWERDALSGLKQVAYLCYPAPQASISGLAFAPEERIPKDIPVQVLFHNVWDLSKIVTLDGYHDLWRAHVRKIQTAADPRPPTYPGCFVLSGMAPSADLEADLRAMNPVLQLWRSASPLAAAKGGITPVPNPATPAPAEAQRTAWEKIESVDMRDPNNGKVRVDKLETPASGFRFTAILPTPQKKDLRVVVVMAKPRGTKPPPPDWKAYSILDDSNAANLNKIYNLQPFVEQLTSGETSDLAPVATAVFTHW